jgi:GNAT superfamily N-acetyltransferase
MSITIRKATSRDVPAMKAAFRAAWHGDYAAAGEYYASGELVDPYYETSSGPYGSQDVLLESTADTIKDRIKAPFSAFVACDGEKVVGYAICEKNRNQFWVNDLIVSRNYQNRGIGGMLFNRLAKGRGSLYLWVNERNPAVKFWGKLGFRKVLGEMLMVRR